MNPIYKFNLYTATEQVGQAYPTYKDDLAVEWGKESQQEFFRGKLVGKLTFSGADYEFIRERAFDTQFGVNIYISYDGGASWTLYWKGRFWKTDCEFDEDAKTAAVTPSLDDRYNAVLNGLEKEFDLIALAPAIQPIQVMKRPMVQAYVPGQSVIGCFLGNMWWEQDCEEVTSESDLINTYKFAKVKTQRVIDVSGTATPAFPPAFTGAIVAQPADPYTPYEYEYTEGGFTYRFYSEIQGGGGGGVRVMTYQVIDTATSTVLWEFIDNTQPPTTIENTLPYSVTLQPQNGATGTLEIYIHDVSVFARMITDVESALGYNTSPIPENDIVPDNRNYSRVIRFNFPSMFEFSTALTSTPTEWGIFQPGQYYNPPYSLAGDVYFPIARAGWSAVSFWYKYSASDWTWEAAFRKEYTLKDTYPIYSVIAVLLREIAPGITHEGNTAYSQFLYGASTPISQAQGQRLFLSPKSNIVSSGYDEPAQKAPVTLKQVLDMLRDCFRCYWFIDEQRRFRIEHISYFMNGGQYGGVHGIGIDLTAVEVSRNGKPWDYGRNQYSFDKPEMTARYQFGWMDEVTTPFEGLPLEILSKYVQQDKIEEISVSRFTSDIDYMLLNPTEVSPDGFALLAAWLDGNYYRLPIIYVTINGQQYLLQNAWIAFAFLQQYYASDLPAWRYKMNGVELIAEGIKRLKRQSIKFPALQDPDPMKLVRTSLGDGAIQKISLSLLSRTANAELRYDTE